MIPRLLGPGLNKAGKFPTPVSANADVEATIDEVKKNIKFQLKKVLCMCVAVCNLSLSEREIFQHAQMAVN